MGQFSENIRKVRKQHGLTQDAVAERCGLSAKYIGELERAEASPSLDSIEKLARGLNVDMLLLIGDDADRLELSAVRAEIVNALGGMDEQTQRQILRIVRLATR